ncbi:putative secreted protein [Propionispora sp. 2/2-37]|uniref:M23 family metallopeptidase n=1 Tax=Propionispora sp. 2/2-37 TaxID=1677858 RepID=UPI0006BB706E|nr:putative secreted protein [Propionispora sp. 2/2-37]
MLIPFQKKGKPILLPGINWASLLISMLILVSVGIFANHQQALTANAVTATELQNNQPDEIGSMQENESLPDNTNALATTPSLWPASGAVTSGFGQRNSPWEDGSELHPGIDIAAGIGTPVVATADGEVVKSGWSGGYGNIVQIDHGNGIETIYGHNSKVAVIVGQKVKKGQIVSFAGSTGRSTGPHVHYEIRVNGTAVDPIKFLVLY